jgi:4-diphosphocytidyl-2-C-methyl-D-erythritol kinase
MPLIREFAPAKINLYLHITGRRTDGYHLLDSLVAFAGVGDEIELEPANGWELQIIGPQAGALNSEDTSKNLVTRVAEMLALNMHEQLMAKVVLTKNLPVASGIGGGSSDAAATLRAMTQMLSISPADPRALKAGDTCGQDVGVCMNALTCYMTADGSTEGPDLPFCHIVLVNPGKGLSTADVYQAYREGGGSFTPAARLKEAPSDAAGLAAMLKERRNDLAPPAIQLMPEINDILSAINATPNCLLARMSGSGATCFGIYPDRDSARGAASALLGSHSDWWVIQTHIPHRRDRRQNL